VNLFWKLPIVQKVRKYPTLKEPENMLQGSLEPKPTQLNQGFFFLVALLPKAGHGLLILEVS